MKNVNSTIESIKSDYLRRTPSVLRTSPPQGGGEGVIDIIDLDLIISHVVKKEREFVMVHPEYKLNMTQELRIKNYVQRRLKNEPLAYIIGKKEFYGLNFKVTPHTLIPRPETELMVEMALEFMKANEHENNEARKHENIKTLKQTNTGIIGSHSPIINIVDVGTGSGNIIISLAHSMDHKTYNIGNGTLNINSVNRRPETVNLFGIDISKEALKTAKQNVKLHNVHKEIKFLHGNLLSPLIHNSKFIIQNSKILILANLPYLSRDIYNSCTDNVKKYEPKTALYSADHGLSHYDKLLKQIKLLVTDYEPCPEAKLFGVTCLMEISPEQKKLLPPMIKKYFPKAKIAFKKDLAQKWRICKIDLL